MKVLIIDSDSILRQKISSKLSQEGNSVVSVDNALVGLSHLLAPDSKTDVVFINEDDAYLPGSSFRNVILNEPRFFGSKFIFLHEKIEIQNFNSLGFSFLNRQLLLNNLDRLLAEITSHSSVL